MASSPTPSTPSSRPRRRTRGEGSLYQRSNGSWVFTVRTETGARKSVSAKTKRELQPKMAELRRQLDAGVVASTMSLRDYLDYFLDGYVAERLRQNSAKAYRQRCRYVQAHVGTLRLSDVNASHLRALYKRMVAEGRSTSTIKLTHSVLSKAFDVAVKEGYIVRNPCLVVEPPKPTAVGSRGTFTLAESARFIAHLQSDEVSVERRARYLLAILAGLRQGEALGLTWEQVHLDDGYLAIVQQVQYVKRGVYEVGPPKGKARNVPIVPEVHAALTAWKAQRGDSEFVFDHVTPGTDLARFHKLLEQCELEKRTLHACRSACASMMTAANVSTRVVADILGHADVAVTDAHYIRTDLPTLAKGLSAGRSLVVASGPRAA